MIYATLNRPAQEEEWRARCREGLESIAREIESGDPDRAEKAMLAHLNREEAASG